MTKQKEDLEDKKIILVDENDRQTGTAGKMKTHRDGLLHRCFSILIFNDKNELLLQQRAKNKYHSPGKWANTCCGHPEPGEEIWEAARKRLKEEMGFTCELEESFVFHYKIEFDNGLTENEIDHVLKGRYNGKVSPNPLEVGDYKWIKLENVKEDIRDEPDKYAYWFRRIVEKLDC